MSNLVIVAIPDENDRVWKVSSEKIPHLTLLYLGDSDQVSNADQIVQFVEHAASTTLNRFYLPVDRRGELGDDKADVLFFKRNRFDFKAVRDFRVQLLKNDNIRTAYDTTAQHDGAWQPHLTLGYPNNPAKPDDTDRDFGFYDVSFNKIAVWMGDYDGPEFLLKDWYEDFDTLESDPMAAVPTAAWSDQGAEFLSHYGVKGMRWGVRNDRGGNNTSGYGEKKREGIQGYLDPQGHDLGTDIAKITAGVIFPPFQILTMPANVRVNRAAYRGAKAKVQDSKEKRDDKKFEKVAKSQEGFVAIHNGAADRVNSSIGGINKKYSAADMADPAKKAKYDREVVGMMQKAYKESANSIGNKRGTKHLDVEFTHKNSDEFSIKVKEGAQTPTVEKVKHAAIDDADVVTFAGKFKRSAEGYIIGLDFEDFDQEPVVTEMAQAAEDGAEFLVHTGVMSPDHFLEHFGVKGMRWGVRKEDVASGAKAVGSAAKSAGGKVGKAASATTTFVRDVNFETKTTPGSDANARLKKEIHGMAKEAFKRTDLPALKDKPEYQDAKKLKNRLLKPTDPMTKAYRKEAKENFIKRLEEAANSKTNASGDRQYTIRERGWELPAEGGALPRSKHYWDVTSREIKHAADDLDATFELVFDDDGFITDIRETSAEESMAQTMELGLAFLTAAGLDPGLEHYGVKGMRWGVRRSGDIPTAVAPMATSRVPGGDKRKTKIEVEGGQNHDAHPDALKIAEAKAKLSKSGVAALSNQELRDMQTRLNLEQQVTNLTASSGQKFITNMFRQQSQQVGNQAAQAVVKKGGKKALKRAGRAAATAATIAVL